MVHFQAREREEYSKKQTLRIQNYLNFENRNGPEFWKGIERKEEKKND